MNSEHKKYFLQEKMQSDKLQTKFSVTGDIEKPVKVVGDKKVSCEDIVYCPFCLFKGKLQYFLMSTGKGISLEKAKCPDCGNTMLMKTIKSMNRITDDKIVQYAKWCFMYRKAGFWVKVKKMSWEKRLKEYGWNIIFWSTYKKLKAKVKDKYDDEEED